MRPGTNADLEQPVERPLPPPFPSKNHGFAPNITALNSSPSLFDPIGSKSVGIHPPVPDADPPHRLEQIRFIPILK